MKNSIKQYFSFFCLIIVLQSNISAQVHLNQSSARIFPINGIASQMETDSAQQWVAKEFTFTGTNYKDNFQKVAASTFEDYSVPAGWSAFPDGKISISSTVAKSGSNSLCMDERLYRWDSPAFNIYDVVKSNGAGFYSITFWVYVDTLVNNAGSINIIVRGNAADTNSFIVNQNGNYFTVLTSGITIKKNIWVHCTASIKVLDSDITRPTGTFNVMMDYLEAVAGQHVYIDDFEIYKDSNTDIFNLVQMDATFKGPNDTVMVMPAFWDGENIWKVRFAPTSIGKWTYITTCSDTTDKGLNNQTGSFVCIPYSGSLDIYKHGFIKTAPNVRYMMYSDGTPFLYIGDTHWSMLKEPIDTSSITGISSMFKFLVDKRVSQGFTVYQSEPIVPTDTFYYNFKDGVTEEDIAGLKDADRKFQYIADKGLVHANAQLFWVPELANKVYTEDYMKKLCRMWVARYSAYPVLWTTAQECDPNFYTEQGNSPFTSENNPWKYVLEKMYEIDPYKHPGTAHQEYASLIRNAGADASKSSFRNVPGHTWYAAQWTPANFGQVDFNIPADFWANGQGKPIINYEPSYDHLWTMEFGARQQSWCSLLNGMLGVAYGAQDIWFYNSDYDINTVRINGYDTVTIADKQIKWNNSIDLPAATEIATYMHNFFNLFDWWKLVPCYYDPTAKHIKIKNGWYSAATIDNKVYVLYLYNKDTVTTGDSLKGLATGCFYTAKWFNPRTGVYTDIDNNVQGSGIHSAWRIPTKPDANDWILYVNINNLTSINQENGQIPDNFSLSQNYPNPFNPATEIKYSIPKSSMVVLKIYNMLGQKIVTLVNREQKAGNYTVNFDASKLSSGVYIYTIQSGGFSQSKKMILIK